MSVETDYNTARLNSKTHSIWCVDITLPAYNDLPELVLRFATQPHTQDGIVYSELLVDIPVFTQSEGSAADGGTFSVSNFDGVIWNAIYPYRSLLNEATIIISELLEHVVHNISTGYYVAEIVSVGFISNRDLPNDNVINFTYESDFSRKGFLVGGRILTARFCVWKFNVGGLLSPEIDACGWQTIQGGDATSCDLTFDGVNGCKSHNNDWRFGAVRSLVDVTIQVIDVVGVGGFDYGLDPNGSIHPPLLQ